MSLICQINNDKVFFIVGCDFRVENVPLGPKVTGGGGKKEVRWKRTWKSWLIVK